MIQSEVGFIGLGNMGAHMVRNLMKKNYKVMVFDINDDAVKAAVQDGKQTVHVIYSFSEYFITHYVFRLSCCPYSALTLLVR